MTHNMKNKKGYHSNHISTEREVHKEMRKQTQKLQQYAKEKKKHSITSRPMARA